MTYSEFKTRMTEDVKKYMDGNHPGYEVSLENVARVNRDFVEIIAISNKDTHEGPAIDVKELWDDAKRRGMSYEEMSREVMKRLDLTLKEVPEVVIDDLNDFKSRAILTLINTEKNQNMLSYVPHREYYEFSIVYRIIVHEDEEATTSGIVTNEMLEKAGYTEEELYKFAYENTRKDVNISKMFGMYVLTTKRGMYGAASILFPEMIKEIADHYGCDLYLIPSSTCEWMAVPVRTISGSGGAAEVNEMIREANSVAVEEEEILGERCYYYDYKTGEIRLAQ